MDRAIAGQVDALVLAENAAVEHVAEHVFAADSANAQFNQTVAEQDAGAGAELAGKIGNVVEMRVAFPGTSFGVMVTTEPVLSRTFSWRSKGPVRIFGPCRSCRMQMVRPSRWAARRRR